MTSLPLDLPSPAHAHTLTHGHADTNAIANANYITPTDAFPLGSIVLPIQISHPSVADLRIELWAQAPIEIEQEKHKGSRLVKQVVLKNVGQGEGEFFQAVYADEPKEGAIKPEEGLAFLHRGDRPSVLAGYGGSEGTWTVRIENAGETRPVVEADLVLCQVETGRDDVVGNVVQAFVGSEQPTVSTDKPWTIDGEEVSEEELAAFRRAAMMSLVSLQEAGVSESVRGLFDNLKEGSKERLGLIGELLKNSTGEDGTDGRWKPGQLVGNLLKGIGGDGGDGASSLGSLYPKPDKIVWSRLFGDNSLKNSTEGKKGRWKPGQLVGNLLKGTGGDGVSGAAILGALTGNPDKIVWSRAAKDALARSSLDLEKMGLTNLDLPSVRELADLPKEAIDGLTEKIRSASELVADRLHELVPDGHPTLPQLPTLQGGHLNFPDLPQLRTIPHKALPTYDSIKSSLETRAAKASNSAQSWAEKRAAKRESFVDGLGTTLEGLKSKMGSFPTLDIDDVKSKIAERQQRLEKPREEFKSLLSTAAEKAVSQQLETVAGDFDLDAIAQHMADAGVDTDELLDSLAGADLDKLLDGGLNLNFRNGLDLQGAFGEQIVGQLLNIEDKDELDALWNGLKEAGFQELATDFLTGRR